MNGKQCRNSQSQATYAKMTVVCGWEVWPRKISLTLPYEVNKGTSNVKETSVRPSVRMPVGDLL